MRILAAMSSPRGAPCTSWASPVENEKVLRQMIFMREDQAYPDFKVRHALLCVALAGVYGLGLTVLQLIERGTGRWGLRMRFFRAEYLLAGGYGTVRRLAA